MKYTFQTDSAAEGLRIDACIRRFLPELPSRAAQLTLYTGGALPQLDGRTFRVKCPF